MLKRKIFTLMLAAAVVSNTIAASSDSYFKKLQSGPVESTDLVEWHQIGSGMAGYCEAFWLHPTDKNVMFMSPDMGNSYGSWDGGQSWQTIKNCDSDLMDLIRVRCMDFSSTNPDVGLLVAGGKVFKSVDRGRSWDKVSDKGVGKCYEMTCDPTNEKVWYIGPGDFWNVKSNHRNKTTLLDPSRGNKSQGYILKSTDGGKTWVEKSKGLPNGLSVGRIIVHPAKSSEIYLCSDHGIYKSTDGGESWRASYKGIPNRTVRDLDSYYDAKSKRLTLYAVDQTAYQLSDKSITSTGGIFRSDDGADSWYSITGNLAIDVSQINERSVQNFLYSKTVIKWFDGELKNLSEYNEKPTNILSVYNRLAVNPTNPDIIYVSSNVKHDFGFAPGDVWMTRDGGKHWEPAARSGTYWASGRDKEYWEERGADMGINTRFAHLELENNRRAETWGVRFLDCGLEGNVYTCLEQQFVRSTDNGKSWHQYDDMETEEGSNAWVGRGDSNLPGRPFLLETGVKGRKFFCSGEHGLWTNMPLGRVDNEKLVAVKQVEGQINHDGAVSIAAVAVDPQDPNLIYTLQFRQLHFGALRGSKDGGKSWEDISQPLNMETKPTRIYQSSLMVDYKDGRNIYFTVPEYELPSFGIGEKAIRTFPYYGAYRSSDRGKSWTKLDNGLPKGCSVHRLEMDVDDPNIIYAALNITYDGAVEGGLYRSTNRGDNWVKMSIPKAIRSVNNIYQDGNTKALYMSCGSSEGSLEEGGVWRSTDKGKSWSKIFDYPYVWQCESSPLDPNILTVAAATQRKANSYNSGAYISLDGGKSWNKVNKNLGGVNNILDFKPDPEDKKKFWIALLGCGWAVGYQK